jgi:hypothetical protein
MKTNTLTRFLVCACCTLAALLSAGFLTSSVSAGPERLNYGGKDKQVEMVQPEPDQRWYVSIGVGTDFDTDETDFSDGLSLFFPGAVIDAFPQLNEIVGRVSQNLGRAPNAPAGIAFLGADLTIKQRSWDEAFSNFGRINAQFGRKIGDHIELFGGFNYVHADGETVTGSNLTLHFDISGIGPIDFEIPFDAHYSDYNSYGGELGFRYLFCSPDSAIRPYVSIAGGGTFVDSIQLHATTNVLGQMFDVYDDNFYNSSFVGTGSLMFGFQSRITRCFSVGIEAGIRYESQLDGADVFENIFGGGGGGTDIAGSTTRSLPTPNGPSSFIDELHHGLNSLNNNEGDRLVIPLMFWAKFRF